MARVFMVGATGLVGRELLRLLQADPQVTAIVAPTRKLLPAHEKLDNPVGDDLFALLTKQEQPVDMVFCCLGTTRREAGSDANFHYVDYTLVVESALTGRRLGAQHCLVVSALGASRRSTFLYNRTKGEMEQALREQNWPRLTLVRPSMLLGERASPRLLERLSAPLFKMLPGKWRGVAAKDVAQTLLEQAFSPGNGVKVLESDRLHCYHSAR
ncbi:Semialdehyde dehydrogenase, NAD binding domain [Serratia quinivorans]|uniref:NAD(P)H-binding protein n=1 Tax=Serratia quinivorans TaxID=137545 RepID=UPI0021799EEC|nr:NAD(P)H-binding protein [Serratia quinivorans]CAI0852334.1 Semialdehyde dehydrogenase, NAD binding domain [Serratia quinivorans]CAI1043596.1 Semialdehyde dehydrogenase, NAD binding domain [Serratia quinivorans]CAI1048677.1 Semialdehyde dehydrogenase, NAD binding domain [Serratia quinivorans]CAI1788298.1 Semialdehyde dehydrogenase, NAD binding domain [Serratia quinivorans]CAI1966284.1 Semialdehyde dehydrogenase, NAD binding domain [Serratia quinivorans]